MKPLVYYCRWHDASLRLRGRDETAVWGHLVYKANTDEAWMQEFRYVLKTRQIILKTEEGEETFQLDEMGTVQSKS
ncbi:hypothetical protein [Candidatus Leptofilum sp.]|uniref:hypothetical protein n=1 Tax=Candidatus Leptofilum sp. TaxID=3241576 RepID=UPI003B5A432D